MRSIILLMLLAVAGHSGGVLAAERVTLIYSGNVDGELEPCGCSPEGDLGGVRRTATLLDHLRAEQTNLFAGSAGGRGAARARRAGAGGGGPRGAGGPAGAGGGAARGAAAAPAGGGGPI